MRATATLQHDELPTRSGQNRKLGKSGITECFEIEGSRPCKWMAGSDNSQSPLCPGCWAAKLWKVRNANSKNRRSTPKRGLIRLGTWRETTFQDWKDFKAGRGQRQDGTPWERPDFPQRRYFVVTRALEEPEFYEALQADPLCLNIQVSVDVICTKGGSAVQVPNDDRLRQLLALPKAVFRLKTLAGARRHRGIDYEANVSHFQDMRLRLAIPAMRILETPLRLGTHTYGDETPLQLAGEDPATFMRCNTPCQDCGGHNGENKVLACAATAVIIKRLEAIGNNRPIRIAKPPEVHVDWAKVCKQAMEELGGTANLTDIYVRAVAIEPAAARNPIWDVKVRQAVRRLADRIGPAIWSLKTS
jgi:hypothetical protein